MLFLLKSNLLKIIPVSSLVGSIVILTALPLWTPTPEKLIADLRVFCFKKIRSILLLI